MRVLAIECAHPPGSICLLEGNSATSTAAEVRSAVVLDSPRKTTEQIAVAMGSVLTAAACEPEDVDFVAAHTGPGSFTGLRIGVTAAKTFAYAVNSRAVGANTLETMAEQARSWAATEKQAPVQQICAVIDAQRGQLFAAQFSLDDQSGRLVETSPVRILDADQWLDTLDSSCLVTGTGLKKIVANLPKDTRVTPQSIWQPTAETLGRLSLQSINLGRDVAPMELQPLYFRKSAAEEKAESGKR